MSNPESTTVTIKPDATPPEKTRSKISLQTIVASVFLNSSDPVIEHVMSKSRPAAVYGKLGQIK